MPAMTRKDIYSVFFHLWVLSGWTARSLLNVAPSGTASQSTSYMNGAASNAIDGNRDSLYAHGSCSHTQPGLSHWWSLRLPAVYRIDSISITNRLQLGYRIANSVILVGNSLENNGNDNPRCALITSIPDGHTQSYNCGGMIGQVVNVYLNGTDPGAVLTLCEVEVYGELAAPASSFSATVTGRNVAVVERKLSWSDALLYCRDFYWDLLSVRSEEEQREVEGVLRRASFPLTKHVWLGLRRSLMAGAWFWMPGASLSFTHWETEHVWQLTSPCGGMDSGDPSYWRDLPCADRLYFICLEDVQEDVERVPFYTSVREPAT